ncbi:MAG: hypothetical protein PUA84_06595, partial [Oscillospiraceae bacterium]|nr:hypothetical protein [Oscillospiraceae bacterium]
MKKRTKKIGSLFLAAVMAISAVPTASFSASAADVPEFQFQIRTNEAKDVRSDTVTITEADLAGGSYTFSAAGYIISENFPEEATIGSVNMAWEPVDENGNNVYNYIRFSNLMDKDADLGNYEVTTSDGTVIKTKYPVNCLTMVNKRTGAVQSPGWSQVTQEYLQDAIDGNVIYSDGNGGCYFTLANGTEVKCTVEKNADGTATLSFPYTEKSTGATETCTQNLFFYDDTLPAGTPIPGPNNIDASQIAGSAVCRAFCGASSDEFAYTSFDITVDKNTPSGTYYIAFDDSALNQIGATNYKAYDPSNIEVNYGEMGVVLGYNRNDKANWLKIEVNSGVQGSETTPSDTTTTTTTTTTTSGTTTSTTTNTAPIADGYSWIAGEYWAKPGEEICIEPTVAGDKGNIMALRCQMISDALKSGAIKVTADGDEGAIPGDAYPSFYDMMFTLDEMLFAGTDADKGMNGVPAAADGSALAQMYYDVADEASVIAAAQSLGLT